MEVSQKKGLNRVQLVIAISPTSITKGQGMMLRKGGSIDNERRMPQLLEAMSEPPYFWFLWTADDSYIKPLEEPSSCLKMEMKDG